MNNQRTSGVPAHTGDQNQDENVYVTTDMYFAAYLLNRTGILPRAEVLRVENANGLVFPGLPSLIKHAQRYRQKRADLVDPVQYARDVRKVFRLLKVFKESQPSPKP